MLACLGRGKYVLIELSWEVIPAVYSGRYPYHPFNRIFLKEKERGKEKKRKEKRGREKKTEEITATRLGRERIKSGNGKEILRSSTFLPDGKSDPVSRDCTVQYPDGMATNQDHRRLINILRIIVAAISNFTAYYSAGDAT